MSDKVLLTGATGMVGRNILENKLFKKYEILSPNRHELNLLDYESTFNYLNKNKPDLIIHAAGKVGGISANISDPLGFLIQNMDMGRNLILAAKKNEIRRVINLGSSCMYPRNARNPIKENMILKGELEPTNEGYALAKIVSAKLCEYINKTNSNLCYKTIIPCNLFGRYDKFDPESSHMIPAVIKRIHEAKKNHIENVSIWGDGNARREFMYTEELTDFIAYAIENYEKMPQYINIGIGKDYSIAEYYRFIAKVIGYKGEFSFDLSKPVGMKQKLSDISQAIEFGWVPTYSLENGIEKTYQYYLTIKPDND